MRLRVASPPDAKYLPLIEHSRAVSRSFCLPTQIHLKYNETTPTEGKITPLQGGPLPVISGVISPINGLING